MDELVVHHTYAGGIGWDLSPWRNHGRLRNVEAGTGPFRNTMHFTQQPSAVVVHRSQSLETMDAVRVKARIYVEPPQGRLRRMNIVEGQLSFAFFINPDLSLQCTFRNPNGRWVGVTSPPETVKRLYWQEVEFRYDGFSAMEQFVNGVMTAARYDLRGSVRGVGPNGIFVGHWPEPDHRYTFRGYITNVQVWRREPRNDLKNILDPCCFDKQKWDRRRREFQKQGYDRNYLNGLIADLAKFRTEFRLKMRGDTAAGVAAERDMMRRLNDKIRLRDYFGLSLLLPDIINWVRSKYSQAELDDFAQRAEAWLRTLPVSLEEIEKMGREACLGKLFDTMKTVDQRRQQQIKATEAKEPPEATQQSGDGEIS